MSPAIILLEALGAAARAFDGDDPMAASALLDRVLAACAELGKGGATLDAATAMQALELHGACAASAREAQSRLAGKLDVTVTARRAVAAYAR